MANARAPKWARDTQAERVQHKAARIAALYLMADRLAAAPDIYEARYCQGER